MNEETMTIYIITNDKPDEVRTFRNVTALETEGNTVRVTMGKFPGLPPRTKAWTTIKNVYSLESN